jgi:hypothetical protein
VFHESPASASKKKARCRQPQIHRPAFGFDDSNLNATTTKAIELISYIISIDSTGLDRDALRNLESTGRKRTSIVRNANSGRIVSHRPAMFLSNALTSGGQCSAGGRHNQANGLNRTSISWLVTLTCRARGTESELLTQKVMRSKRPLFHAFYGWEEVPMSRRTLYREFAIVMGLA